MKKLLFNVLLLGLAVGAYAQGQITLDNINNSGTGPTATTGGLFWICPAFNSTPTLIGTDFNVNFYGGFSLNPSLPLAAALQLVRERSLICLDSRFRFQAL